MVKYDGYYMPWSDVARLLAAGIRPDQPPRRARRARGEADPPRRFAQEAGEGIMNPS